MQSPQRGGHALALAEQREDSLLRNPIVEAAGEPFGAQILGNHTMDRHETTLGLGQKKAGLQRVGRQSTERKAFDIAEIQPTVRRLRRLAVAHAHVAAEQERRADAARRH